MHRAAVWQHSNNSSIKIFHNSIEHFFWNPSDFSSDDVISCLWIVFTNSFFQVLPQKMVRLVEVLGIGWPGVIDMTQNESVPWKVIPEVFKCSVREIRRHLISLSASEMGPFEKIFDSFFACYFLSQGLHVTCFQGSVILLLYFSKYIRLRQYYEFPFILRDLRQYISASYVNCEQSLKQEL